MNKAIYFDNAATTPLRPDVLEAMLPCFTQEFGNPSGIYKYSRNAKALVEQAREQTAKALGCLAKEIYFTSGGTESDNWAIKGIAKANEEKGKHIITCKTEHHAVLHSCRSLEKDGFEVTYLNVDEYGSVDLEELKSALRDDTILITIMFANNEIGTIAPIKKIADIAKEHGIIFHTDAVQAVGHVKIDVNELGIDMLSLSAHKFGGPKGVGALYVRKGIKLPPFMHGGAQESFKRAGTENVPGIVGLGRAIETAVKEIDESRVYVCEIRDMLIKGILEKIPYSRLNGANDNRLPGNVNISFEFIEGESMLLLLDAMGICASSGSACTSGSLDPSHVLLAIGLPHEKAHGSLRLTLSADNTKEEAERLLEVLPPIVERLRDMSPLYEEFLQGGKE